MKKIITFLIMAAMVVSTVFSASAAGLSESEQKILDALSEAIPTASGTINIPDNYIAQAKNFMLSDDSIDEAAANEILANIAAAKEIVKDQPISSISDISTSVRTQVVALASASAETVGATLTVSNDSVTITKDNTVIFQTTAASSSTTTGTGTSVTNPIKQTDTESTASAVALSFAVICALGATLFVSRKLVAAK